MTEQQFTVHEIQPGEKEFQNTLVDLFRSMFPEDARYLPYICKSMEFGGDQKSDTLFHHWLVLQDDLAIGFALFNYLVDRNVGFFRYLAVDPGNANAGIGYQVSEVAKKQLAEDAKKYGNPEPIGYVFEAESPEMAKDEAEKKLCQRRLNYFIKQCKSMILPVDYVEPLVVRGEDVGSVQLPDESKPMVLLLSPLDYEGTHIDADLTRKLVEAVLFGHYRLAPTDPAAQAILDSISDPEVQ